MATLESLNKELKQIKAMAYDHCSLRLSDLEIESEGQAYKACKFKVNGLNIVCRNAKITPKKIGQFVTFWKRNQAGVTEPFEEIDQIDFYVVNVTKENKIGQFVFPKLVLLENKIMSSASIDGKRGFRVYPNWDMPTSKQAKRTQTWQAKYFIEFVDKMDLIMVTHLYKAT